MNVNFVLAFKNNKLSVTEHCSYYYFYFTTTTNGSEVKTKRIVEATNNKHSQFMRADKHLFLSGASRPQTWRPQPSFIINIYPRPRSSFQCRSIFVHPAEVNAGGSRLFTISFLRLEQQKCFRTNILLQIRVLPTVHEHFFPFNTLNQTNTSVPKPQEDGV